MKSNFFDNEDGIIQGSIYVVVTMATILVLIIALGPLMHFVMELYRALPQEDTVFADSTSGFNSFMSIINQSELVWEMSMVFFAFLAIFYMFVRAIKKQSYTQYDRV